MASDLDGGLVDNLAILSLVAILCASVFGVLSIGGEAVASLGVLEFVVVHHCYSLLLDNLCGSGPHTTIVATAGLGNHPLGLPLDYSIQDDSPNYKMEYCTKDSFQDCLFLFEISSIFFLTSWPVCGIIVRAPTYPDVSHGGDREGGEGGVPHPHTYILL